MVGGVAFRSSGATSGIEPLLLSTTGDELSLPELLAGNLKSVDSGLVPRSSWSDPVGEAELLLRLDARRDGLGGTCRFERALSRWFSEGWRCAPAERG